MKRRPDGLPALPAPMTPERAETLGDRFRWAAIALALAGWTEPVASLHLNLHWRTP